MRRYTNVIDVSATTLKTTGTGTTVIANAANSQLLSLKSVNNKLTIADGTGGDVGTLMLNCAVDLTSTSAAGEVVFSPDSAAPNFKFRRVVAGTGMQINTSPTDPAKKDALELQCLVTLGTSSTNGTSVVGNDSGTPALTVRSLVSTNPNIVVYTDDTGKQVQLKTAITCHIGSTSILNTTPWGISDARLSLANKDLRPTGWFTDLLPLSVPSLYWHGTLVDAVVVPPITLSTVGSFNAVIADLPTNVPFSMFATVVCATPFRLSFVFNQLAGGSMKQWNAILSSSTPIPADTVLRIPMTTTSVAPPNGVQFSTETTPRPMLGVGTTNPECLYATITQDITGIYPSSGADVWILGFDLVFGDNQPINVLPSQNNPPINNDFPGDARSPVGWTFGICTYRVLDGNIVWSFGLRTPDGAPTYNILQDSNSSMQATLTNLQIGATYQITGYAASRPAWPAGAQFDINLLTTPAQNLATFTLQTFTFDPFGPVGFTATNTTHVLEFHGRSGDVLIGGISVVKT